MYRKLRSKLNAFKYNALGLPRLKVETTDAFLASWPRSGNTWLRYMVAQALWPQTQWDLPMLDRAMPSISNTNISKLLRQMDPDKPRIFKSHDAFRQYVLNGKVVYIIRNGRDSLLSMYHYRKQMDSLSIPLSDFLHKSLAGEYRWGAWHTHVEAWYAQKDHPNVQIIRYEDLRNDTVGTLRQILSFFNHPRDEETLANAVKQVTVARVDSGFSKYAANRNHQFTAGRINTNASEKDSFSADDEAYFQQVCGQAMNTLGYQ